MRIGIQPENNEWVSSMQLFMWNFFMKPPTQFRISHSLYSHSFSSFYFLSSHISVFLYCALSLKPLHSCVNEGVDMCVKWLCSVIIRRALLSNTFTFFNPLCTCPWRNAVNVHEPLVLTGAKRLHHGVIVTSDLLFHMHVVDHTSRVHVFLYCSTRAVWSVKTLYHDALTKREVFQFTDVWLRSK